MHKTDLLVFKLLHSWGPFFPPVIFVLYSLHVDTEPNELVRISKTFQILKLCAGVIYKCRDNKETFLLPRLDLQ